MPYSNEERNELDFYKSFVSELRNNHIDKIKQSIPNKFKDDNKVLQSFEDIVTGLGLEDATLEDGGALYESALFNPNIEGTTQEKSTYFDSVRSSMMTTQNEKVKQYTKSELLNNTLNRDFTELYIETTSELPLLPPLTTEEQAEQDELGRIGIDVSRREIKNGDILTVEVNSTMNVWLIENNKKRRFINKEDFYNSKYLDNPIKKVTLDFIKSIDDGKLIVLETQAPYISEGEQGNENIVREPYLDEVEGYGGEF